MMPSAQVVVMSDMYSCRECLRENLVLENSFGGDQIYHPFFIERHFQIHDNAQALLGALGGPSVQHGGHMHMGKLEQSYVTEWVRACQVAGVDEGCGVSDADERRTM